jgi:hypothetical protein
MRASFRGVEVGVTTDNRVHVCGVRGSTDHHVLFQRGDTESTPADIHFEYRDQGNGGYDFVKECRLSRRMLSLDLSKRMRSLPDVVGIDVVLDVDDSAFIVLSKGLAVIFEPCPERLLAA